MGESMATRILAVENEENWKNILEVIFYPPEYQLEITDDANEARKLIRDSVPPFDIIITNIHLISKMPDIPVGLTVLNFIRSEYPHLPRIILTGHIGSLNPIRETLEQLDADELFDKSKLNIDTFKKAVDKAISRRQNEMKEKNEREDQAQIINFKQISLKQKHNELQEKYTLLNEKIQRLHLAYAIEADLSIKYKLEKELKQVGSERDGFEQDIRKLETQLEQLTQKQPSSSSNQKQKNIISDFPDFDVFLAHNSKDKLDVERIAEKLKQHGLKSWIDKEQIPPGRWFQDIIQQAISEVKTAAIFIGASGLGKWQVVELRTFISRCVEANIPVIPVLLPNVTELPENLLFLNELNWVSFKSLDDEAALDNLVWGISGKHPKKS